MANSGPSSQSESHAAPKVWVTAVPLVLLLLASVLLVVQIARTNESSAWVDHSEVALALSWDIERQIHREHAARLEHWLMAANAEATAENASTSFHQALEAAQRHVVDNEYQLQQLAEVRARYESWERTVGEAATPGAPGVIPRMIAASNSVLNSMLEALSYFEAEERRLRSLRVQRFEQVNAVWFYGALPLLFGLGLTIAYSARRQILRLVNEFNRALAGMADAQERVETKRWVRDVLRGLTVKRGESELTVLGRRLLQDIATASGASVGALYLKEGGSLKLLAGLGVSDAALTPPKAGIGIAEDAVDPLKPIIVAHLVDGSSRSESEMRVTGVATTALIPCHHSDRVLGVMELGFRGEISTRTQQLIDLLGETVGTSLVIVEDQERLKDLLLASRIQAEALQAQQEELRATNEELAAQTEAAKVAHAQLEERKELLETINQELLRQRDALARAQQTLQQRAVDLGRADRYKSEFLASMSHELRTPLNSILILADALSDNMSGNLTAQQVKFAETIASSGKDLLTLINDVLDLSKIEAGAMEFEITEASADEIAKPVIRIMDPLARERGLQLITNTDRPDVVLRTDVRRAQQILKNLLSNACKFTPAGTVSLSVEADDTAIRFLVEDTGIGIAAEDTDLIFEPFRQGEGAPNRRFSGTGLGLSISRDLARKLDGDVVVESELGKGSRFTLILARTSNPKTTRRLGSAKLDTSIVRTAQHTEEGGVPQRPVVLLVTDDASLVQVVSEAVRAVGFECVSASSAEAGVALAESTAVVAMVLDLALRVSSGSEVLSALEGAEAIARLPRHLVNSRQEEPMLHGDASHLGSDTTGIRSPRSMERLVDEVTIFLETLNRTLPVRPPATSTAQAAERELFAGKTILLVDDDVRNVFALTSVLESIGIRVVVARNGMDAVAIAERRDDLALILMDLMMPEMDGLEATRRIRKLDGRVARVPIIALTAKAMSNDREACLEAGASEYIAKPVDTERLLALMRIWLQGVT